jgi:putative ABC transport system substrate-binding protein
MRRREFIALVGGAAAWPFGVRAQQAAKVARIGYLSTNLASSTSAQRF